MLANPRTGRCFEPLPVELMRRPLAYMQADHLRQRVLCALCEQIARSKRPDPALVGEVLEFLRSDLPAHAVDEEHDFFPLLRRRSEPADEIEGVLGRLSGEAETERLIAGLEAYLKATGEGLPADLAEALRRFAAVERRHVALKNAVVMPLARVRLTEKDLRDLSARMAARRGVLFADAKEAAS